MEDGAASWSTHDPASLLLGDIVDQFADEVGGSPTLSEILDIIGTSIPSNDAFSAIALPMRISATLRGGASYRRPRTSRVAELNDNVFVNATDLLMGVAAEIVSTKGLDVSANDLASAILRLFHRSGFVFADVSAADVMTLSVEEPKKGVRSNIGDVIAIPAHHGGFNLASVIARNSFGTALGVWKGIHQTARMSQSAERSCGRVVYTDDHAIRDGSWPVVGHDDLALSMFPDDPEIYHRPDSPFPDPRLGEFGAAETAAGALRQIGRDEAEKVGLLDGSYQQGYLSSQLADVLAEDT